MKLKSCSEAEYEAAFRRVDTDGSGFITVDEISVLLREALNRTPTDYQVRSFLAFFDSNADGKISWEEFKAGLTKVPSWWRRRVCVCM